RFIDPKLYLHYIFAAGYINNFVILSNIALDYLKYLEITLKVFQKINLNITLKKLFVAYPSAHLLNSHVGGLSIIITTNCITTIRNF
ncbi:hypothetical protein QR685DRAFT_446482, partial [Neurospora intermedia]